MSRGFISGFGAEAVEKMHNRTGLAPQRGNWGADRAVFERRAMDRGGTGPGRSTANPGGWGCLAANNESNSGEFALVPMTMRITRPDHYALFPR